MGREGGVWVRLGRGEGGLARRVEELLLELRPLWENGEGRASGGGWAHLAVLRPPEAARPRLVVLRVRVGGAGGPPAGPTHHVDVLQAKVQLDLVPHAVHALGGPLEHLTRPRFSLAGVNVHIGVHVHDVQGPFRGAQGAAGVPEQVVGQWQHRPQAEFEGPAWTGC